MNYNKLDKYYNKFNEDKRLNSRHGTIEFLTSIKYIQDILINKKNPKVIDIGAGTGKYSLYLSELGYDVTAVELIKHNLKVIESKSDKIKCYLGNAIDLSRFENETYDLILLFGPMYHLISKEEKIKALMEAKRIIKDDGVIMISYCMKDYAIIKNGFIDNNIIDSFNNGRIDKDFNIIPRDDDLYSYVSIDDIDELNKITNLNRIKLVNTDGYAYLFKHILRDMNKDAFNKFIEYHLSICEKKELLGIGAHVIDIVTK